MKLWVVVWYVCSVAGTGTIARVHNNEDGGWSRVTFIGGEPLKSKLEPAEITIGKNVTLFGSKEAAIDFAEHTKFKTDCSTSPAEVYEMVNIATSK